MEQSANRSVSWAASSPTHFLANERYVRWPTAAAILDTAWRNALSFASRIELGPDLKHVDEGEERKAALGREWQSVRLRWFHQHIPEELLPLAQSLGVNAEVPSFKQQSLDETGFWVGSISSGVDRTVSPKQIEDFVEMPASSIAAFLSSYDTRTSPEFNRGELVFDGLPQVLTEFAKIKPQVAIDVLKELVKRPNSLSYVAALLEGLAREPHYFIELSPVIPELLQSTLDWVTAQPERKREEHSWLVGRIADMVTDYFNRDALLPEHGTIELLIAVERQ